MKQTNNPIPRLRKRSESSAVLLLSAKSFVWSPRNQSDEALFPNFPDEEEIHNNKNFWFDCLHLDCIGTRPYPPSRKSTANAVIDFLLVIMIALIACYFLLRDCVIGGLGQSNGRFVSFADSFRTCFVFGQIEKKKRKPRARKTTADRPSSPHHSSDSEADFDGTTEKSFLSKATSASVCLLRALRIKYSVGTATSLALSKWPVWMRSRRHVGSFLLSYISINTQFNLIFDTLARSLLLQLVLNSTAALYKFRKLNFAAFSTAEMEVDIWYSLLLSLMVGEGVSMGFAYDTYSRRNSVLRAVYLAIYSMLNWRLGCTVVASAVLCITHRYSDSLTPDAVHICKCIAMLLLWTRYCGRTMKGIVKSKMADSLKQYPQVKEITENAKQLQTPGHPKSD